MNNVLTNEEQATKFDELVNEARKCLTNTTEAEMQNTPAYIVLKISKEDNEMTVESVNCFTSDADIYAAMQHFAKHFGSVI